MSSRGLLARCFFVLGTTCATISPAAVPDVAHAQAPRPVLSLRAASPTVELSRFRGRVFLDLGIMTVAGDEPFEIHMNRRSYAAPIVATWVRGNERVILSGIELADFRGLPGFYRTIVRRPDGTVAAKFWRRFCPGPGVRLHPDAPARSPYPRFGNCPWNPYTLGSVAGIQAGWGVGDDDEFGGEGPFIRLAEGRYTATMFIARRYRRMFGLSRADASATVRVRVVDRDDECPPFCVEPPASGGEAESLQPAATAPGDETLIPDGTPMPDLRSLPAFSIGTRHTRATDRDFLIFAANVWNAGVSPLVVDGFRRQRADLMDAFQYFFDTDGNQVGHAPAGTMEWDARDGHHHWHFTDFARYRLLDSSKRFVMRSHKEAFCLANTDAIDYTVPGANWNPDGTDLHTACGSAQSLTVREVLDSGSGDTYFQFVPGQSFNITSLPNGIYYVEVRANPARRLHESDLTNNVSYRKVRIGGTPGHRTVRAAQVGIVDEGSVGFGGPF
jgi:Lysyl oxidase